MNRLYTHSPPISRLLVLPLAATISIALLGSSIFTPARAQIGIGLSVQIEPPALLVVAQPPIPEVGYLWTPGYWAYRDNGYIWNDGVWVMPPSVGMLWTPPFWGWGSGGYLFHGGYWGAQVGYYGGVNYGFGYGGNGYQGGRWEGGHFAYNSTVNNFGSRHVTNVYRANVTTENQSHTSFVGGPHGLPAHGGGEAENRATAGAAGSPASDARETHPGGRGHRP